MFGGFFKSLTAGIMIRVVVWVSLCWAIAAALAAYVIHDELTESFDSGLRETVQGNLPLAVEFLMDRPANSKITHIPARTARPASPDDNGDADPEEYIIYQIRDASGRVLLRSDNALETPFAAPLIAGFWQDDTFRYYSEPTVGGSLYMQVAEPLAHRREATFESAMAILLPLFVLVPVLLVAIWFSVRGGMRPIYRFRQDLDRRGAGNMEAIAIGDLPSELAAMGQDVNLLLDRLRAAISAERAFASNSAHELRTPIASMLAQTQQLLTELPTQSPHRDRALLIEKSLGRLRRLSEKLLQWSRAESGLGKTDEVQELDPIIDMLIEDIHRSGRFKNTIALTRQGPPLQAPIDPDAFGICVGNLLENALVHGDPGVPVQVRVEGANRLIVENTCNPVPPDILAKLTRRFARHGNSPESSGLGLSIVVALIEQAGGAFSYTSPIPGQDTGFQAVLTLPQATIKADD